MVQKDDIDLFDYVNVVIRKWKMILLLTLLIVLLTGFITLMWPKTYNSSSTIRLAEAPDSLTSEKATSFIISPESTKIIIKSSTIIEPVLKNIYGENNGVSPQGFSEKHLDAEIIKDAITTQDVRVAPYLRLITKFTNAEDSYKFNLAIANEFLNYENSLFNQSIEYIKEKARLSKENDEAALISVQENVDTLKNDIANLRAQMNLINSQSLGSDGLSKATLLQSILQTSLDSLQKQEERKLQLERTISTADIDLQRTLDLAKEASIETLPEVANTYSSPNMTLNLAIGLIAGIFISLFLAFLQEGLKKQKRNDR